MKRDRVLVIDQDPQVRATLPAQLRAAGFDVTVAAGTTVALASIDRHEPDILMLDTTMPNADCLSLFQVRRHLAQVPVLFTTVTVGDWVAKLRMGGDDYVLKPLDPVAVIAALRALVDRGRVQDLLRFGDLVLDVERRTVLRGEQEIVLTSTESRLLRHLIVHHDRVLTKAELLRSVWGYNAEGGSVVVERYVSNLRRKLDGGEASLISTVRGVGYHLAASAS